MIGPFCGCKAKNNEEYKTILKRKIMCFSLIGVLGVITIISTLLLPQLLQVKLSSYMTGFYSGIGSGFILASLVLSLKYWRILRSEEKLKEERLKCTDERLKDISQRAFKIAAISLLVILYMIGLIGGLFYPVMIKLLAGIIAVFVLTYFIAYRIYESKM